MSEKCPECGAYSHDGKEAHGIKPGKLLCSLQSREHLEKMALQYYEAWLAHETERRKCLCRFLEQVVLWQGKHAMLRHENNKLRKKVESYGKAVREAVKRELSDKALCREIDERAP